MDEMIETSFTLKKSEKLNERIYQEFAKNQGVDPSKVRGTGFGRDFVPPSSKGNILDCPPRGTRPLWAHKPFGPKGGRGPLGFILIPLIFNKRVVLKIANRILAKKIYFILNQIVVVYCYVRYVKFIYRIGKNVVPSLYQKIKRRIWKQSINYIRFNFFCVNARLI